MWLRSVRTSQPSQGVGASRFDAAPATFAAVHSVAREYRSSRSAVIAASWSRQCEGSTQPGARASADARLLVVEVVDVEFVLGGASDHEARDPGRIPRAALS